MTAPALVYDSAQAAGRILVACQSGNLPDLESELEWACSPPPALPPDCAERWELLDAVAGQMLATLARMRRGSVDRFEGAEVQLRLLRHLAGAPAAR
jgi:hypothetical protein